MQTVTVDYSMVCDALIGALDEIADNMEIDLINGADPAYVHSEAVESLKMLVLSAEDTGRDN